MMRWRRKRISDGKLQIVRLEAPGWVWTVPLHALSRFFVSRDLWAEGASPRSENFCLKLIPPSVCRETEFWWAVEAVKQQTAGVRISSRSLMIYVIFTKFSLLCSMLSRKNQKQKALQVKKQQWNVELIAQH